MLEKEIIDVGYKRLAKKYHPDSGGSDEAFKALQAARGNLVALLAGWRDAGKPGGNTFHHEQPFRVVYPAASSPPIVPGSAHTVDDVFDLAGRIVDIFNPKPKRKPRKRAVQQAADLPTCPSAEELR